MISRYRWSAACAVALIGLTTVAAHAAHAAHATHPAQQTAAHTHAGDGAPDISLAVVAHQHARAWLDAGDFEPAPGTEAAPEVRFAGAVLRLNGRVVGLGKAFGPEPGVVRRAVQQAANAARQDAAVRALGDAPLVRLTLELEVGGEPTPLVGATFEQTLAPLHPAMQGLALRHGDQWGYLPAGHVLARGMAAPLSRGLLALMTEMQVMHRDLPDLRAAASTAVYAVPSVRLVQSEPAGRPRAVARLTPALAAEPLSRNDAARTAAAIAARLCAHATPPGAATHDDADPAAQHMRATLARLGLRGAYDPLADEQRTLSATPADQALCAYALARAANSPALAAHDRAMARDGALAVLHALEAIEPGEDDPRVSPQAAAFALLACAELARMPGTAAAAQNAAPPLSPAFTHALTATARACLDDAGTPGAPARAPDTTGNQGAPSAHARAIALAAFAASGPEHAGAPTPAELAAHLHRAWAGVTRADALHVAPWLLVAERELARTAAPGAVHAAVEPARGELDLTVAALIAMQHAAMADPAAPPEAWGAYPVTSSMHGRATAQSARPMHAIALWRAHAATPHRDAADGSATASASATPRDARPSAESIEQSLMAAARFLAQLQSGAEMDYALRTPANAHGGIMAAPYDPVMHPAAQGMALLAVVETLDAAGTPAR